MARRDQLVIGLDIGTTKIGCVVAELRESGAVDVVGVGESPSRGIRKGVVVNLEATVEKTAIARQKQIQTEAQAALQLQNLVLRPKPNQVTAYAPQAQPLGVNLELLAVNSLGEKSDATPAVVDEKMYLRTNPCG